MHFHQHFTLKMIQIVQEATCQQGGVSVSVGWPTGSPFLSRLQQFLNLTACWIMWNRGEKGGWEVHSWVDLFSQVMRTETSNGFWVRNKHFLGRFHFAVARQRWIPFLTPSPLHLAQELKTSRCGVVIVSLATLGSSRHVPCAVAPLRCCHLQWPFLGEREKVCSDGKFFVGSQWDKIFDG